jgi:hypothetical protein
VVSQTKNFNVEKRPGGGVATVYDTKRGIEVHHGLNGGRSVLVEHDDHSRVFAGRGGHGYVQRPYGFHGHEYARRSYYYRGHYYHAYYGRYRYHNVWINPYYPTYYYGLAYYGWVYNPWGASVPYAWGWGATGWYGYYGAYFTPYARYSSAAFWLTDYVIANTLQSAYQANAQAQVQAAALNGAAPLSLETKQLIADEVRNQIAIENTEAQSVGNASAEPDPVQSSIQGLLTDDRAHVFVVGQDLDVVDSAQGECALSEGDAVQLSPAQIAPDATAANLTVLASKGGKECPGGDTVSVQLADLQEMQNHMRETIDQGMRDLQKKQGQGGLPAAPAAAMTTPVESAVAASAPAPPAQNEVAAQISQESREGDAAEKEAAGEARGPGQMDAANAPPTEPLSITTGQTIDEVVEALGPPVKRATIGAKTIYIYKDVKVTFLKGKVTDVQ